MGFFISIFFFFIVLSITFFNQIVATKDVLNPGDEVNSLYSTSNLVSNNGKFTLGFFTIPSTTFTHLGIWYTNTPNGMKVWVANRDTPMIGNGVLMIDDSGTLKVINGSGPSLFTLFNNNQVGSGKNTNTRAVLQDSGDFLVYDSTQNRTLWQSFDYPTDILVPGMKLGYNLTTKQNWTLNSWLSDQIPATGAFTMRLEQYQNSYRLLIYRHGEVYWASGPWEKDNGTFPFLNYFSANFQDDFNLISDASGMYLTSTMTASTSSTLQLTSKGQIIDGKGLLMTPEFCYGYQRDDGCAVSALPNCRSQIDSFVLKSGDWAGGSGSYDANSSISLNDCMEICWKDCNCLGFKTNSNGTGCITWSGGKAFRVDESGQATQMYVLVSSKPPKTKDVLMPGVVLDSLNSNATLVSANGNFTLGFSTFISSTTNFTYLGIWYASFGNGVGNGSIVWVSNRDNPMTGSGMLMMDDLGSLKVVNGSGATLFNVFNNSQVGSGNNTNTRGVLQDSGNFLVYDATDNRTLWQSFDHPTDTLLPGMKIGYNLTTGQNWTLNSWLSDVTPATGAFTMTLEQYQNSPQLLIYRRGEVYRASGPLKNGTSRVLDSLRFFNFPPDYNQSLIFDASGSMYFTYQANNFMFQLAPDGHVNDNHSPIPRKDFCYGYKSYDGCAVSAMPNCRGQRDSFVLKSGDWTFGPSNNDVNSSISLSDCMERCWNDCNCVGFITSNSNGTGCITWVTNNTNKDARFQDDPFGTRPQKYVLVSKKPVKIKRWMLIVVPLASVVLSILAVYLCYVRIRRRRLEEEEIRRRDDILHQLVGSNSFNYGDELERGIKDAPDVKVFSLKAIMAATSNFSNENKLGQGGYGPVYKGKLPDGREIAVKRLSKTSGQGIKEFKNELILISKLQHTNLVRLYGCCIHQEEKMLIYEFMPNKSLDFFLFDDDKKVKIDWRIRFNIIEGIAQGLLYLHKYSRMRVIHRDLKVSNILLDQNMNPKIADFGLARIFQQGVSEEVTKRVVGTYGYMAPEYAMHGTYSIKSDVFSFGVLILEIVNGKKNSSFYKYDMPLNLVGYAWELWKREATLELKDEALGESYDVKQLLRAIHIGLLCVQENANDRPTISEVISMLNNEITDLPIPKQPAFFIHPDEVQQSRSSEHLLGNNIQGSINGLTITTMQAR